MTDEGIVAQKLAFIETCVEQLRTMARPERIATDVREERASHIVSDARLGEPNTNAELFDLLRRAGWIDDPQCDTLRKMVGFRNHDLLAFATSIRTRLQAP